MQVVGQPVMKKDAMALVTGKPVFTQDVAPADCLVVKVLRSPHANANILSIKTDAAKKVPGIEAVYTWEDVPESSGDDRRSGSISKSEWSQVPMTVRSWIIMYAMWGIRWPS